MNLHANSYVVVWASMRKSGLCSYTKYTFASFSYMAFYVAKLAMPLGLCILQIVATEFSIVFYSYSYN